MKKTGALLIGSALGLAAGQTMASGFGVSYQSVSAMGTAYAGSAVGIFFKTIRELKVQAKSNNPSILMIFCPL